MSKSNTVDLNFMDYPSAIKSEKLSMLDLYDEIKEYKDDIRYWETLQLIDINNDKQFSNVAKRQTELNDRKATNDEYSTLSKHVNKLERKIKKVNIEIEFLIDMMKNLRAIHYYEKSS